MLLLWPYNETMTAVRRCFLLGIVTPAFLGCVALVQTTSAGARFCFIDAKDLEDKSAPKFDWYPSKDTPPKIPAKLDLRSNPIAKMYRTIIRQEMAQGANFASYYRIAVWGCGTSCAQFAVVNLKTGHVITIEGVSDLSGVHFGADDFLANTDSEAGNLRFKKNSRLLVLIGAINEDESKEGAFYYVLKGDRLSLVHKTVIRLRNRHCPE